MGDEWTIKYAHTLPRPAPPEPTPIAYHGGGEYVPYGFEAGFPSLRKLLEHFGRDAAALAKIGVAWHDDTEHDPDGGYWIEADGWRFRDAAERCQYLDRMYGELTPEQIAEYATGGREPYDHDD